MLTLQNNVSSKPFWKKDYAHIYPVNQPIQYSLRKSRILKSDFGGSNALKFKIQNAEVLPSKKIKARKLKLNPSREQKLKLNQWAGCVRFLYNTTISCLTNPKNKSLRNKYKLRNRFATITNLKSKKQNSFYNNKPWLKECLSSIRKYAIYDAKSNLKSCFSNLSNGNIEQFIPPFKSKKSEILNGYGYSIEKQDISKKGNKLLIANIGEIRYFKTKQLHKLIPRYKPDMDCKIQKSSFGEYFLIIPYVCKPKQPVKKEFSNPISIDPGVRKVLTTFNPNKKESLMFGSNYATDMMKLLVQLDKMISMKDDKKKIKRLRKKIFYMKKEFRDQTASYISKNHDLVLMPKLNTKNLTLKANRRLKTKTVRNMLSIGHSKLFASVKDKCWENGCCFLEVSESYTSQTCPRCGSLHKTSSETYCCSKCGYTQDRDVTGAVNILLRALMA